MQHFFKKTVSVILSILIIIPVFSASAYTTDDVIEASSVVIFSNEGSYTSINANDRGAVSIGVLGWHANRALSLLKSIINANGESALTLLGEELYNEIINSSDWNSRIFNEDESAAVSALLGTQEGIDAQDKLAYSDIKSYVNHGLSLGISDGKALVYFADLENQMGSLGSERVAVAAISLAESADKVTLNDIYNAAMADTTASNSPTRRKNTYEACKNLDLDNLHETTYSAGKYVTTASLLYVRFGPGTAYDKAPTSLKKGTNVTVTDIYGEWGKIRINGITGWICLRYATLTKAEEIIVSVLGDVTGDNKIHPSDARLILRYSASLTSFSESQIKCADINGDGKVTPQDARKTLRVAAGLEKI